MAANQQLTRAEQQERILAVIDDPQRFQPLLPNDVDVHKFMAVIKRGLQQNPALMAADKASLILSCQQAAQDGLMPDGREGALVMYGQKVQWQPMIGGIRKRAADAGFDIRADVVYANDTFDYDLGDDPRITHKAPPLGTARGDMIGAYAIATGPDGQKYREVMSKAEILAVAAVSRSGANGPWKGSFAGEMWRKTVARRLFKTLPMGSGEKAERAAAMIQRDDERNFAFQQDVQQGPSEAAQRAQAAARVATAAEASAGRQEPVTKSAGDSTTQPSDIIDGEATEVTGDEEHDPLF